jgi:Pregnancy-associated plasma protein-A
MGCMKDQLTGDKTCLRFFVPISLMSISLLFAHQLSSQPLWKCSYRGEESTTIRSGVKLIEDKGQRVYIPVVVHVVYNDSRQNISDEQIFTQLRILDQDFTRNNPDTVNTLKIFRPIAGNANINFFLPTKDEFGNPTNGVTRTYTTHGPFANDDLHFNDKGGKSAWSTSKYLNIWIADLADGVFGFSSPLGSDPLVVGVAIDYNFFGSIGTVSSPFNRGRTSTHEIGHWMGLNHLWGSSGGCVDDDDIADTPLQTGPSTGCDLTRISCGNLNMVQNFMDNSDDTCMNLFTQGQVSEMRKNLFTHGQEIIQNSTVTGVADKIEAKIEFIQIDMEVFQLKSKQPIDLVLVRNLVGQEFRYEQYQVGTNEVILTLSGLSGVFIFSIWSGNEIFAKKILIR